MTLIILNGSMESNKISSNGLFIHSLSIIHILHSTNYISTKPEWRMHSVKRVFHWLITFMEDMQRWTRLLNINVNMQSPKPWTSVFFFTSCSCYAAIPVCNIVSSKFSSSWSFFSGVNVYNHSSSVLCPALLTETDANVPWKQMQLHHQ